MSKFCMIHSLLIRVTFRKNWLWHNIMQKRRFFPWWQSDEMIQYSSLLAIQIMYLFFLDRTWVTNDLWLAYINRCPFKARPLNVDQPLSLENAGDIAVWWFNYQSNDQHVASDRYIYIYIYILRLRLQLEHIVQRNLYPYYFICISLDRCSTRFTLFRCQHHRYVFLT